MSKRLVLLCLLNFFVAALLGLLLRYVFVNPLAINFKFLTHAHSHVAMLGWVYLMLYYWIVYYFIPVKKPVFKRLFWITQLAVLGMVLSFPFQGYAAVSITFSTLHVFCSYYFAYLVWKNLNIPDLATRYLLKASLIFMVISTFGVWCLGPAVATVGQTSAFYQIAIQFFLHFQFNGWFIFAVLSLFVHQFNMSSDAHFKALFWKLVLSTLLTFALIVNWFAYHPSLLYINAVGVILQLWVVYDFIKFLKPKWSDFYNGLSLVSKRLYLFSLSCFILKIGLQTMSLIPQIADVAFKYHNFVIGFIHLTMLGVISGFLFAFLTQKPWFIKNQRLLNWGIYCFISGFILTESILFAQGISYYLAIGMLPYYYLALFISSILLPLGIFLIILNYISYESKTTEKT